METFGMKDIISSTERLHSNEFDHYKEIIKRDSTVGLIVVSIILMFVFCITRNLGVM